MKMKLSNIKMMEMLSELKPFLSRRDRIGYAAARNYRFLTTALTEYTVFRRELIEKYGTPDLDENGAELGTISLNSMSPKFKSFCDELAPFNMIEHEVELMCINYEDTIGELNGEEILQLDWMLED